MGYHEMHGSYPLVMTNIAIENDHRKFVDFPIKHVVFTAILNYQRVKRSHRINSWDLEFGIRPKLNHHPTLVMFLGFTLW